MEPDKTSDTELISDPPVAVLEHLTGPSRGTVTWLGGASLEIHLDQGQRPRVREFRGTESDSAVALLRRTNGSFEIEVLPKSSIWVNRKPVSTARLNNYDMIEFGTSGPISRFCICANRQPIKRSFPNPVSDSFAYFKASRRPFSQRVITATLLALHRLLFETTYVFRIAVIVALAALGVFAYQQSRMYAIMGEQISTDASRLDELARALARNREQAITPADLEALSSDLGVQIETAAERLTRLERLSNAAARVIREKRGAVLMVQSAYSFRDRKTGRMLRNVLGPDGKVVIFSNGLPMLSLEGDGPIAERQFIGTAFAIGDARTLVTNRHVAMPWENDAVTLVTTIQGLEPILRKLVTFVPGQTKPITANIDFASETDDLALLRLEKSPDLIVAMELADEVPKPGAEIIVMGYPTGLRTLLAQAGRAFVSDLQQSGNMEFWTIAERLAAAGKIVPLASGGILGSVNEENLVYDAETTHGGSGGPVFNLEGQVIGVNTAVLPEFGGSNLGIPAERVRKLIKDADSEK